MDEPGFYISPEEIAAFAQMKAAEDIARIANAISPIQEDKEVVPVPISFGKLGPGKIWNYNL